LLAFNANVRRATVWLDAWPCSRTVTAKTPRQIAPAVPLQASVALTRRPRIETLVEETGIEERSAVPALA
jgi:hypothetical protein